MSDLKPCPFCGGEAEIERQGTARQSTIYNCTNCGCRLETGETWQAPSQWNERELTEREAKLVEVLKPFARVGELKSINRNSDAGLWTYSVGEGNDVRITAMDCINVVVTLKSLGIGEG